MAAVTDTRNVIKFVWDHPANNGRRTRALLRATRFQLRARLLRRRTMTRLGETSLIWADLHRTSASKAVYANPPDHPEMATWRQLLRSGDLFIDVGANIGSYAILAAELGAEVIALEPAEDTFRLLVENAALNDYPITALRVAAGAASGTALFTSGRDSGNQLDPAGSVEVTTMTLDSIIGGRIVGGMKVDVEGFEIEVLKGCERALSEQRIALIQLEWNTASRSAVGTDRRPVADLLARHGYSLLRPDRSGALQPLRDLSCGPDVFASPSR